MRSLLVSLTVPFVDLSGAGIVPAPWGVLGDAAAWTSAEYAASVARAVDDRR